MKKILKKLQENKLAQILFCGLCMLCLMLFYVLAGEFVKHKSLEQKIKRLEVTKNDKIILSVEARTSEKNLVLNGWVIRLDAQDIEAYVQLKSIDGTSEKIYETEIMPQNKIDYYFGEGWEYSTTGYKANLSPTELKKDVCYEILLALFYKEKIETEEGVTFAQERKKISTEYYLYNGKVYSYNPLEFSIPKVNNMEFQQAIQNGTIRSYSEDGAWLYEYDNKLYWIVNYSLLGLVEERPEIPLIIYTSEKNKLPLDMQAEGRGYVAHYLSNSSYASQQDEEYYLYSTTLDMEYLTTFIQTGVYRNAGESGGWRWKVSYRTDY